MSYHHYKFNSGRESRAVDKWLNANIDAEAFCTLRRYMYQTLQTLSVYRMFIIINVQMVYLFICQYKF